MEIFENLKYRLENASTEIKIYLVTFIIALFHASLIVTTYFFVTEHIVFKDSSPEPKSVVVATPIPVITQKPKTVQNDKTVPSDVSPTAASTASFDKK